MAIKIVVPELGESVLEATVSRWLKKEGDFVNVGDVLVELETDKVNLEVGAKGAGILQQIAAAEGKDVKVGDVLGMIDEKAEQPKASAPAPTPEAVEVKQVEQEKEPIPAPNDGREPERSSAPQISPVASRLARDKNVDVSQITGTGSEGRVTKADVELFLQGQEKATENGKQLPAKSEAPPVVSTSVNPSARPEERTRMSRRRRTIAQPHLTGNGAYSAQSELKRRGRSGRSDGEIRQDQAARLSRDQRLSQQRIITQRQIRKGDAPQFVGIFVDPEIR